MTDPFVIFALPRSRTTWLSQFLTTGGYFCHHDMVATIADFEIIRRMLGMPRTGVSDTGIAHGWRLVREYFPKARFVVIRRPRDEIEASLKLCGVDPEWVDFDRMELRLAEIEKEPSTMTVEFHDLNREGVIRSLFEFCLEGVRWDRWRWLQMRDHIIEIDMPAHLQLMVTNRDKLAALKQMAYDFHPA